MLEYAILFLFTIVWSLVVNKLEIGDWKTLYLPFRFPTPYYVSKMWFDSFTFTHINMGILAQKIFPLFIPTKSMQFLTFFVLICLFEIIENTYPFTLLWKDVNYNGDSIINIITDILTAVFGYYVASFLNLLPALYIVVILYSFVPSNRIIRTLKAYALNE